jgi:hypothetical protein
MRAAQQHKLLVMAVAGVMDVFTIGKNYSK